MIVPMKKATIVVQLKDAESAVKKLRSLGVIHVEHIQEPKSKDISIIADSISAIDEAINILSMFLAKKECKPVNIKKHHDPRQLVKHITDSYKRLDQLQEYSAHLKNAIDQYSGWGDFNPEQINFLAQNGIFVKLYQIPKNQIKNLPKNVLVKTISVFKGMVSVAIVSREKVDINFKEVIPPKMGIKDMHHKVAESMQIIKLIKEELTRHTCHIKFLLDAKESLKKNQLFYETVQGMGLRDNISYLTGYLPFDSVLALSSEAEKEKWGIVINEPSSEDNIPTLIRNPKWISIIKPVFKLLEIMPGYRELDISPLFLIFLSLFFGMIIGDAGYGAVYFLLTFIIHMKFSRKSSDKKVFFLFYLFSGCAIFWGLLTGTVFGQEWFLKAGFKPFVPILNDTKFLQAFCFFLGAFHLTLAHVWCGLRKLPSLTAFADAGWICVLWSAFFIAKTLILSDPFPYFVKSLLIAGVSLVILCTNPQKNIFKTIGEGLGAVALSIMNNFTDVVSYVRLFAVGLAGVAISDTVNSLAAGFGVGAASFFILFLGHTINIVLGPMSVLVHGIRLNVLEFSGHASLSWSGIAYKPFKEE